MAHTKTTGLTGRYGPRYGKSIKNKVLDVEKTRNAQKICPNCMGRTIRRQSSGVWFCKKCGLKTAGSAYRLK